jgi:cytosine/uracil/thiamine/allantoin permease
MFGLLLVLIVVGSLATLVAGADPDHARLAPYIGFVCLLAGVGAVVMSALLGLVGGVLFQSQTLSELGFFLGYMIGGLSGGLLGLKRAAKPREY